MTRMNAKLTKRKTNGHRYAPVIEAMCKEHGLPMPQTEWPVCAGRRWRYDFAWVQHKVALEVQGGLFVQGRHTRGAALLKEHEKLNTAAALGWRVMFVSPSYILTIAPLLSEALGGSPQKQEDGAA